MCFIAQAMATPRSPRKREVDRLRGEVLETKRRRTAVNTYGELELHLHKPKKELDWH